MSDRSNINLNAYATTGQGVGSGTTIYAGKLDNRTLLFKTISSTGSGISIISGDSQNIIISGSTGGVQVWGDIGGDIQNQTDLWNIISGITGATEINHMFLTHTGGTELNTITPTPINWDGFIISGSSFSWTGGSSIYIEETGNYELSYNIPYVVNSSSNIAIGVSVKLNDTSVIDLTAGSSFTSDITTNGNVNISTVISQLNAGDKLTLIAFRSGLSGSAISSARGSILLKKRND